MARTWVNTVARENGKLKLEIRNEKGKIDAEFAEVPQRRKESLTQRHRVRREER
jgi:hypothetical protein